jgi:hypothetical protein
MGVMRMRIMVMLMMVMYSDLLLFQKIMMMEVLVIMMLLLSSVVEVLLMPERENLQTTKLPQVRGQLSLITYTPIDSYLQISLSSSGYMLSCLLLVVIMLLGGLPLWLVD